MSEEQNEPSELSFNPALKVDFQGSRVTSDGGPILVRELDERLGLGELIAQHLNSPYKRHFESTCYHPLLLFNREGDCLAAKLRPGNVHSAEDWEELLLPEIDRQQKLGKEVVCRADAAFARPAGEKRLRIWGSKSGGWVYTEPYREAQNRNPGIESAVIEGAARRLRPIMMTMLIATLGLLPAAMSHEIGSDSQGLFAIVIVGALIVDLIMSIFLVPTFYFWWVRPTDKLPAAAEVASYE